jgi:hypothetical protein
VHSDRTLKLQNQQHGRDGLAAEASSFDQRIDAGRLEPKGI